MEDIRIEGTDDIPKVILSKSENEFLMEGRSLPEDVNAFYDPIIEWMEEYAEDPNPKTTFDFKMNYFNTASSKVILDILMVLEEMQEDGKDVGINWYYPGNDEDMKEAGEEYGELVEVPIELISF